jgi:hypothetical protein
VDKAEAGQKLTKLEIESDGTREGTTLKVNGKAVKDLASLSFYFWNDDMPGNVSLGYSVKDNPAEGSGEIGSTTYYSLCPPACGCDATLAQASRVPFEHLPRVTGGQRSLFAKIGARQ